MTIKTTRMVRENSGQRLKSVVANPEVVIIDATWIELTRERYLHAAGEVFDTVPQWHGSVLYPISSVAAVTMPR